MPKFVNANFDTSECDLCETSGVSSSDNKVCLNPECFGNKRVAHIREKEEIQKIEATKVGDAITKWTASKSVLLGDDLRLVLTRMLNNAYGVNRFAAFEPWYEHDEFDDSDAVKAVPDKDLGIAIMRLVVYLGLPAYGSMREAFEEKFSDAAKFYGQESISDVEVPA